MAVKKGKEALVKRLFNAEKALAIMMDQFLLSNTRVDRDKVLKKREEVKTIKYILNEYI